MVDTFFDGTVQSAVETSAGPLALPILYKRASLFGVFFLVPVERAGALLAGTSVEPWPLFGRAVVALYVWQYRDSTVGSYDEVGLGIQARRRGTSPSLVRLAIDMAENPDQGIWVVHLPVTTEAAFTAGVEAWGYPKYVTPIETSFGDDGARARLGDELEVSIGRLGGPRMRGLPVVTYTAREGRLLRTVIEVDHRVRWGSGRTGELRLLGDGPTAASLRAMGLEGERPVLAFRTDTFRAKLPAGVDVGPSRA